MPSIATPRSQKRFVNHTRFSLSLRTISSPKRYHKLLLFRLSPVPKLESSDKFLATLESKFNAYDGETDHTDVEETLLNGVELYCMEATCPHLSAPLSHAEFADSEDHEQSSDSRPAECDASSKETHEDQQQWDLEPEMRDMEDVVGQPGRTIVCPWHLYDFDLRDGSSSTGMSVCVYSVEVRKRKNTSAAGIKNEVSQWDVYIEEPEVEGDYDGKDEVNEQFGNQWEVVEVRGVSEDFADPPIAPKTDSSTDNDAQGMLSSITSTLRQTLTMDSDAESTPSADLPTKSLLSSALLILETSSAPEKIRRTQQALEALRSGKFKSLKPSRKDVEAAKELFRPLDQEEEKERISRGEDVKQGRTVEGFVPPRADNVKTVDVWSVKNRGKGGNEKSRILMLHALANIEQWAIDLAWDIMARFADFEINGEHLPAEFFLDWAKVAEDEAKHFSLLNKRLGELGSYFGAHSVHAGLWDSALETSHSLLSRLAIIHLVAEARGLDVNPLTIEKFRRNKDYESVKVLEIIHSDEITRAYRCYSYSLTPLTERKTLIDVTTGHRWFTWVCERMGLDPIEQFREEVRSNFRGKIKGPFNAADRLTAGMTSEYYTDLEGLAASRWHASGDKSANADAPDIEQSRKKAVQESGEGDLRIHPRLT
ncbi:hypothetical protein QFC21_001948 [Naganishia friedmannii]|uniref:Uncharacterized protein n=1 Tax=Naganishia friedmannii TaxID=89922 RepID=A0ACC2VYJ7_9TREE|nr:hypothetical protein QFC21_001948 [Naganishia friedmannii]